jgi:hypothetical protein
MKKTKIKKLTVAKETLYHLGSKPLEDVGGGVVTTRSYLTDCADTYYQCSTYCG